MPVYKSAEQLIGHTPLVELTRIERDFALCARLLAKVESFNPGGSAKDRVARAMLDDAEEKGLIKPSSVIIEPTSGNTGIGLAAVAAARGYRVVIVMPDTMSVERIRTIRAYGAEVILTDGKKGMQGSVDKAEALAREIPDSFIPGQFVNPANALAHYRTTGPEIWADTEGHVDVFAAGVGTGGTLTGVGRFLKEKNPRIRVVAAEPAASPLLSGGAAGPHGIQGIGANFIPEVLDRTVYDEVLDVTDEDALRYGRLLAQREGLLCGISSGCALYAGVTLALRKENEGKTVVVLLPDTGDRYLSTALFNA